MARKSGYHHAIKAALLKYGIKLKSVIESVDESSTGKKSCMIDLFIESKLTDDIKDQKLGEIQDEIGNLELQRIDAGSRVVDIEKVATTGDLSPNLVTSRRIELRLPG